MTESGYIVSRKWSVSYIMMALAFLCCVMSVNAASPAEAFSSAKNKIAKAGSLTADFTMNVGGSKVTGKIYSKGKKFAIVTDKSASSWYNGKDLYTYDPSASTTYLFNPTASELKDVNPLLYLDSSADYKVTGSKTKKAGVETVVLIPKKSGSSVRSVTVELDSKTFLPRSIKISTSSGQTVQVSLSNVKLNATVQDSNFEYPETKYKGIPVEDMR